MPLKNARIHLRVTDEEKQSLVEKATLARQSVSQYILSLSENKTIIVVDGADEVTRQLLKIGNNINQIAIVANTSIAKLLLKENHRLSKRNNETAQRSAACCHQSRTRMCRK